MQDTAAKLKANGMVVECLSAQLSKQDRTNMLARFRRGDFRALIVSGQDTELSLPCTSASKKHALGWRDTCLHLAISYMLCR